jgi:hypothetical protein
MPERSDISPRTIISNVAQIDLFVDYKDLMNVGG